MTGGVVRSLTIALALAAAGPALWATMSAVQMAVWLSRRGVAVNWFLFRVLMPRYFHRYKTMTAERDGKPGPFWAHFVIPINLALLLAVAAVLTRMWGR